MSTRRETDYRCDFCSQKLYLIEQLDLIGDPSVVALYCYGCREPKDKKGWGRKSELRDQGKLPR